MNQGIPTLYKFSKNVGDIMKFARHFFIYIFILNCAACVTLNETGQSVFMLTSEEQEKELGEKGYQEVLSKEKISKDQKTIAILERVGHRIAKVAGKPDYQWEFTLIESDQLNAWCMPGGKVAVYTGILPYMQTEAGMAVVLGHEVAHATLRHSGQRISREMGIGTALQIFSGGSSGDQNALLGLLGAGARFGTMPFDRKHETQADLIGLKYMAKAGYDPKESVAFWQRFGKATQGSAPPEFLSTHPGASTRIKDLQQNMSQALSLYNQASAQYGTGTSL
ncbi:MAG: M48 family metallopeptidase [Bdellovibrionales bacterium]|nr:M48 family metallopeptidase [Bdellovibrionales bacterium]